MPVSFTDRELDVMAVLWELGSATVAEVRERLEDELAYTTVLTVLRTLEDKGHVGHREEGKAHRYVPLVARQAAGRSALSRLVDKIFGGSHELLLTQLVSDKGLSREELERLRAVMDARLDTGVAAAAKPRKRGRST
jgi:BlaI family penicillinase repressor